MSEQDAAGETWTKEHLGPEESNPFRDLFLYWAVRDNYSRFAMCPAEIDADRIVADHNEAADLRRENKALREALEAELLYHDAHTGWQYSDNGTHIGRATFLRAALAAHDAAKPGGAT